MTRETIIQHFTDSIKEYQRAARNIGGEDSDDLFQECACMILEMSEERLNAAWNETQGLKPFFIRVLLNQYRSETSRFHKEYRKQNRFIQTRGEEVVYHNNLDDVEEPEIDIERLRAIKANMASLNMRLFDDPVDHIVWEAYVEAGSLRKAVDVLNAGLEEGKPRYDLKAVHEIVRRMRETYKEGLISKPRPASLREKGIVRNINKGRAA